jgi:cysteine-rich repeat protein
MKTRRSLRIFFSRILFAFALFLASGRGLQAATFIVDRTDDTAAATGCVDATPNDCSLRGAVIKANTTAGVDVITLPAGTYTLTLTGVDEDLAATGDLDITESITINGADAKTTIIDGNGTDRVLHIDPNFVAKGALTVDLSNLTIQNGHPVGFVQDGGGILNEGTLSLTNCTIKNNTAGTVNTAGDGGGIYDDGGPVVDCVNSTFSGNSARDGAALSNSNTATFTNCTISGNTASDEGGGILSTDTLTMINSTIVNNMAGQAGGGILNADNTGGVTFLLNTIVANNTVDNCSGTITSNGHNLDSGNTCLFTGTGDLINKNPNLGFLQDNGGPTETHALLSGSPAIDSGDNTGCPNTDQRGFSRPTDGNNDGTAVCDIGSFETICGDGVLSDNEACDDGNTVDGDCCSSTCQFEAQGSTCDDGNAGTSDDQCDGTGACVGSATLVSGSGGCQLGTDSGVNGIVSTSIFLLAALLGIWLRWKRT